VKRSPEEELARLRTFRNFKKRDLSIGDEVARIQKKFTRSAGALGGLDEAWASLLPPELGALSRPQKLTAGGLLTVRASDAAAVYELDQWVRSGGLAVLRGACKATLRRVKVVV
jgi:hypothetical protein